jgi:hypothetical protein
MASVYLTTPSEAAISDDWWTDFSRLNRSASACASPIHTLSEAPQDADIILFVDSPSNTQSDIRGHKLSREFSDKIFVYSTHDRDIPVVPGVYTCAEQRWYMRSHMRAGFYIKVIDHDWIQPSPIDSEARHLFSFCGAFDTHPLRRRIGNLRFSPSLIRDTSQDEGRGFGKSADTYRRWQADYSQTIREAAFILCPRGVAPSSYRIFEAMKAGRVPVIVADAWVPPVGPDWAKFSLNVAEACVEEIPQILERISDRAAGMGLRARQAWEDWFSEEQAFQTIVRWCLEIKEARRNQLGLGRYRPFVQLVRPFFFRHVVLGSVKKRLRRAPLNAE